MTLFLVTLLVCLTVWTCHQSHSTYDQYQLVQSVNRILSKHSPLILLLSSLIERNSCIHVTLLLLVHEQPYCAEANLFQPRPRPWKWNRALTVVKQSWPQGQTCFDTVQIACDRAGLHMFQVQYSTLWHALTKKMKLAAPLLYVCCSLECLYPGVEHTHVLCNRSPI